MTGITNLWRSGARHVAALPVSAALVAGSIAIAACSSSSSAPAGSAPAPVASGSMALSPPSPDPRVGLKGGMYNAQEAAWNVRLVSNTHSSEKFIGVTNSDLAFVGNNVVQGNYNGYQVWDMTDPKHLTLKNAFSCPASQSDVSVYNNLLFVSAEAPTARLDCGNGGVADTVSKERIRGIRIFDATDMAHPKYVANVQTCRGSHTHTVVHDPNDPNNIYIYVSGSAGVRPDAELPGCVGDSLATNTALFRIEVIQVPLAHPENAKIVNSPRIFHDLAVAAKHGELEADIAAAAARAAASGRGGAARAARPGSGMGPTQCHDITVYPAIGRSGGACGGYGILLDIRDPAHPERIGAVTDSNFAAWHSVTFNNDGTKILFSDEWGGGSQPRCRTTDKLNWGADAIYSLNGANMGFLSYYKMPAPQTVFENCVAHNGSLIPIPGRDVMVQAFYQGGLTIFDWTDGAHPKEIGFFDRGPVDDTKLANGGYWSTYWYNGYIIGSEIARGLDILELTPSAWLSQNEIDAAKSVRFPFFNAQDQPKLVWPPSFALSGSYLDQLVRNNGLAAAEIGAARSALASAQGMVGAGRKDVLTKLAARLHADATSAPDAAKVHKLAYSVGDLANASQ